ncbi:thiamine pyrophosphate-dependent enzyme [Dethiosulfatarculus sandiegensis]|uniref:2-oxoglutarate synthase n=1 Tax=Dethiosulfatarculus sandiegensis TaxID=1429043 RepID=A0A0D2GK28_9BACT|nr:thiamine pyrophosphate-dependent enzyme [Dethiosulfatarculus sandiegensis]KIX15112.1 2-oxoglutarate synthase [Dethiosulfatarculus sandiegensis]
MTQHPLWKYLRPNSLPHFFCPGCGAAQVLNFFLQAADETHLDFDKFVGIGGVGCAARIPVYIDAEALHGVHGRTIPWATGIKLHKPELKVVIFAGDGDASAIGGGHLIHACRRNLDVTMIVVNNLTYGMTGGQMAPTTPLHVKSATTPYGNAEEPFDICKLAETAGATYVARWSTAKPKGAKKAIKEAINHTGFSLVEIVTQCPTNFGRRALGTGSAVDGLEWIKKNSVTIKKAETMSQAELEGKFVQGTFVNKQKPVFMGSSVC